jgi:hypothetical protein
MEEKKDLSVINCIATSLLAIFLSVPVHELFHLLTHIFYGSQLVCFSAGAVEGYPDFEGMSVFNRVMVSGGSASILNVIVGFILLFIVLKVNMGSLMRVFMVQLTGAHLCIGIGYFLIGGFFGAGDWGNVFYRIADAPGVITALRIVLSVLGSAGIVWLFFMLNYLSYYFIEDSTNKKVRLYVAFRLHLLMLLIGYPVGILVTLISPATKSGELNLGLGMLYNMMWIPFFWGFMFTGPMRTLPPKKSLFLYNITKKPNYILLAVSIVLILVDIFVFGPGIYF